MDKIKTGLIVLCMALACSIPILLSTRIIILLPQHYQVIEKNTFNVGSQSEVGQVMFAWNVHSTIRQYRTIDGQKHLIYTYSHPAALTTLFENLTAAKITGDTAWNLTDYLANVTYIALGIDVGLTTASTVLPGEWNRTDGVFEYIAVGHWNYSASFYPNGSGITNATSMNWLSGIGTDLSMAYYDTFADISYTSNDQIDVEWEVDVQYS